MRKDTPIIVFAALFMIFTILFLNPGFTGFTVFNPSTPDVNITVSSLAYNVSETFTIILSNINSNWSNYTSVNLTLNNSNLILTSTAYYNISNYSTYSDITWNLSANTYGKTNITIILSNSTHQFNTSYIINVTDSVDDILVFNKSIGYVHNGTEFNLTLENLNLSWVNYTSATISYDSGEIQAITSDMVNLGLLASEDNASWTLKTIDKGQITINLTVIDIYNSIHKYNITIDSYGLSECGDVDFYTNEFLIDRYNLKINTTNNNWSVGNYNFISTYSDKLDFKFKNTNEYDESLDPSSMDYTSPEILNIANQLYYFSINIYKNNYDYCSFNDTLDKSPLVDDILFNATYEGGIKSCDDLSMFYLYDTNNSINWNGYDNLTISFGDGFSTSSIFVLLDNTTDKINLTTLTCSRNNVLYYNLTFIGNASNITVQKTIDHYYTNCSDIEIVPYDGASQNHDLNFADGLKIRNINPYDSNTDNYFYNYTEINVTLNPYLINYTTATIFANNISLLNKSDFGSGLDESLFLLSNITFNRSYAIDNDNKFYFEISSKTDFNSFTCNKTVDFVDTSYPDITIDINSNAGTIVSSATNVTLSFNITNTGSNATNLEIIFGSLPVGNCNGTILSKPLLATNQSDTSYNCSFILTDTTPISTISTYEKTGQLISLDSIGVNGGILTLSLYTPPVDTDISSSNSDTPAFTVAPPTLVQEPTTTEINEESPKQVEETSVEANLEEEKSVSSNDVTKSLNNNINSLISRGLKHTKEYFYEGDRTILRSTIKNANILPQYDVYVTVTIPKEVAQNTSLIQGNFTVIKFDPVIQFYFEKIDSAEEIVLDYTINKTLTKEEIDLIATSIESSYSTDDIKDFEDLANQTSKNVNIKIDVKKGADNKTNFITTLDPEKDMEGVKVYMEIPKCLAEHLSEIEFERDDYEVIEEDPLIAWTFDELNTPESLEFKTLKEIDPDCWEQIIILPIADSIKEHLTKQTSWYYKFWPFLIIMIILMIAPFVSKHANLLKKDEHKGKHILHKDVLKELEFGFEEIAISSIIILNVMDFFEILPPDLDFVKKIISWTFLSLLMYQADITKILFGVKHKIQDMLLIVGYFGLMLSDVLNAFNVLYTEILENHVHSYVAPFLNVLLSHNNLILYSGFYGGLAIIFILTFVDFTKFIKVKSMLGAIHESGRPSNFYKYFERFFMVFIAYITFFLIFFKFFMEWFAIAVDAVIAVVGIILYLVKFVKNHHKHYHEEHFIYKIGTIGEEFYEKFIELFSDPKKIMYGLTGMLVVHLLIDLSNFIIPYLISIHDSLYFLQLANDGVLLNHTPLIPLLKSILSGAGVLLSSKVILVYLLQFFAIIAFLIMPAIIWYDMARGHKLHPHRLLNTVFLSSIITYFSMPLLRIEPILEKNIVGIDLLLLNIFESAKNIDLILYTTLIVGATLFILSFIKRINILMMIIGVGFSQVFFLGYVYSYLYSWANFFINAIGSMIHTKHAVVGYMFVLFFIIITLFYIIGFMAYVYIIIKHWGHKKVITHNNHHAKIIKLVDYLAKSDDIIKAKEKLEKVGWKEQYINEAMVRLVKAEGQIRKFVIFERKKKENIAEAKEKLLSAGWDPILVDLEIKKYWHTH